MKKKIIGIVLALVALLSNSMGVFAALGDVEAYTTYTDILAYINHFLIQSYNINGYTVVVAEDLANFGFDVEWDGNARTLNITRNPEKDIDVEAYIVFETAPNMIGKQALPVLSTDIRTYVNGVEAKSYNVDGRTVVDFESLSAYGPVQWHQDLRVIKLWVEDGLSMCEAMESPWPLPKTNLYSADGRTISVYDYEVSDYLNVGWYETEEKAKEVANMAKNKAALSNLYVGQEVCQWILLANRYGVIRSIDYSTGKVKVYWNYVDASDNKDYGFLGNAMLGLYSETWEDAKSVNPLY